MGDGVMGSSGVAVCGNRSAASERGRRRRRPYRRRPRAPLDSPTPPTPSTPLTDSPLAMTDILTPAFIVSVLAAAVAAGTAILFACLGELITERAGVLNLGIEGIMLMGALAGAGACIWSGSAWVGAAAALVAGAAMAAIHALLCVGLRANQVVSGLALTIFGAGLSAFLGRDIVGVPPPSTFRRDRHSGAGRDPGTRPDPVPTIRARLHLARARGHSSGGTSIARERGCVCGRSASGPRRPTPWASTWRGCARST